MNHPTPEEWLRFVDDESPPAQAERLAKHLQSCGECAAQIAAWRRAVGKLRALESPSALPPPRQTWFHHVAGLGLAAALVLGAGFGLGWLTAPKSRAPDAAILAEMRRDLRRELALDLLAAVSQNPAPKEDATQRQLRHGIQAVLVQAGETWATRQLAASRVEDRRDTARAMAEIQTRFASEFLSLRRDLETLASTADADINLARLQINELAVNKHP
jgi:hypothetical protein